LEMRVLCGRIGEGSLEAFGDEGVVWEDWGGEFRGVLR
jgi:hypothetical protein